MRHFKRFARDERGVFAIFFAVIAVVLVAVAGAAVDYSRLEQVRNRSQIALDSAALALQAQIYTKSKTQLRTTAQALLSEGVADPDITATVGAVEVDTDNGQLLLRAELDVPMSFVSLVGVKHLRTAILSQVTRKKTNLEVSFVLDNSGSMKGDKISKLRSAAVNAINILFYGTKSPGSGAVKSPNVKVAIVPFTFLVNVGSTYENAAWVDRVGEGSIANDNFDDDNDESTPFTGTVDRIALIKSMTGQSWKGCVESRVYPHNVTDELPNASVPDTLFVPSFAPDEPGPAGSPDSGFNNSYVDDSPSSCNLTLGTCTCVTKKKKKTCTYFNAKGAKKSCSCSGGLMACPVISTPTGLSDRELQERICKYAGATVKHSTDTSWNEPYTQGPNGSCPNASIQPLTDNVVSLTTAVNNMVADGGTNIHEGTAWGFRSLSPTEPFTEGRSYASAASKILIVMTDGENTYWHVNRRHEGSATPNMNGTYYYTAYGYQYNERLSMNGQGPFKNADGNALQLKMNILTLEACTKAKEAGITIYTIGLEVGSDATTKAMLTSCASATSKAYFPSKASDLDSVFSTIAEELSQLRLER